MRSHSPEAKFIRRLRLFAFIFTHRKKQPSHSLTAIWFLSASTYVRADIFKYLRLEQPTNVAGGFFFFFSVVMSNYC